MIELNDDGTIPRGVQVRGKDRARLVKEIGRRYKRGEPLRALAASTGRSYGFVYRLVIESGQVMRPRGGARRRPSPKTDA